MAKVLVVCLNAPAFAGVSKQVETEYLEKYRNQALFLKLPVRGERQEVVVTPSGALSVDSGDALLFKVGEQVRIVNLRFGNNQIRFEIATVDQTKEGEIQFRFSDPLEAQFSQREDFDRVLSETFTAGLSYTDIEAAKQEYIRNQFEKYVRVLVGTAGTTTETVLRAVAEENPHYVSANERIQELETNLVELGKQVEAERTRRSQSQDEVQTMAARLNQLEPQLESLQSDKAGLENQLETLVEDLNLARTKSENFGRQIRELEESLNVQSLSTESFSNRIESLRAESESLKAEREALASKTQDLEKQLTEKDRAHQEVSQELRQVTERRDRLQRIVNDMTSDKGNLESRYLETQQEKESLETARSLSQGLHFRNRVIEPSGLRADLYLLSQKLGELSVETPRLGEVTQARLLVESRDVVRFSDKERQLHSALGEKLEVEPAWVLESDRLQTRLEVGDPKQAIGARENGTWAWQFSGEAYRQEPVALRMSVFTNDGLKIDLDLQEFALEPSTLVATVREEHSWWSLAGGLGVGLVGGYAIRKRRRIVEPPVEEGSPKIAYVRDKRL